MTRSLLSLSLLASTALVSPAAAEITPAEVWQDLRAYMEAIGYTVTGTESDGGDQLTVSDVAMVSQLPDDEGEVRMDLGTITLTDTGGAVQVGFEDVMPIRFAIETDPGSMAEGVVEYRQSGLDMQVTGSVNAPLYTYRGETLSLVLTELTVDGEAVGRDAARMDLTFDTVSGRSLSEIGSTRSVDQDFAAESVTYDVFFGDFEDGANMAQFAGRMASLTMDAQSDMPLSMPPEALTSAFPAGLLADVTFAHQGGEIAISGTEDGVATAYSATSDSGSFSLDVTDIGVGYDVTSQGVDLQLVTPDVPVPIEMVAQETAMTISGPIRPTDEAQPFEVLLALRGFEMADMLWNMFDPGKALPRDPATLEIDLSGEARQLVDLFDETAMAGMEETSEIESLTLNALRLDAAGALLTGTGAVTFDNSDTTTFEGFPAPDGSFTFELTGANRLLDTLVNMGLLPPDQAMGARLMMSMFAQPAGDDVLSSTLELRPDGQILANGQRLR